MWHSEPLNNSLCFSFLITVLLTVPIYPGNTTGVSLSRADAEIRAPLQTHQMRPPHLENVKAFLGTERSKSQQKWNRVISISKSKAQKETFDKQQASKPIFICLQSPNPHTLPFCWQVWVGLVLAHKNPVRQTTPVFGLAHSVIGTHSGALLAWGWLNTCLLMASSELAPLFCSGAVNSSGY